MKNKCFLTFDYELFLGSSSGTLNRSLIEPTNRILEVLERNNAKAIFFVDSSYLMCLKKRSYHDFNLVKDQLRKIVAMGSEVQLHLHPQWLDASVSGNEWTFDSFDRFRLHSLSESEALEYFNSCKELLEDIIQKPVIAFRAGGWCIQPFDVFGHAFSKLGILVDSSVVPGLYKNELPHHYFDFRGAPSKSIYRFSSDPAIDNSQGPYIQCPVTIHRIHGLKLVLNTILLRFKSNTIFGDGKGLYKVDSKIIKLHRVFKLNVRPLSVESLHPFLFKSELRKLIEQKKEYLCLVMHPKTFTEVALENLEYICSRFTTLSIEDLIAEGF